MKSLKNEQDVSSTKTAVESHQHNFLKIPNVKTPWLLLSLDYVDGFTHWVDVNGMKINIPCIGGIEGKGFAPDVCGICDYTLNLYKKAKKLVASGKPKKARGIKEAANDLRAKFQVLFLAIKGERVIIKERDTKGHIKKVLGADFEQSDDSDVEVGILSLSKSQFQNLISLIGDDNYPFVKTGSDLYGRVLWTTKKSKKGSKSRGGYTEVEWSIDPKKVEIPEDIEIPEDLKEGMESYFDIDENLYQRVIEYLKGGEFDVSDSGKEKVVEKEEIEDEEEEYEDDDDVEIEEEEEEDDFEDDEEIEDDIPEEDDFEDDDPEEALISKHSKSKSKHTKGKKVSKRKGVTF